MVLGYDLNSAYGAPGFVVFDGSAFTQLLVNTSVVVGRKYRLRLELKADGKVYYTIRDLTTGETWTANQMLTRTFNHIQLCLYATTSLSTQIDAVRYW